MSKEENWALPQVPQAKEQSKWSRFREEAQNITKEKKSPRKIFLAIFLAAFVLLGAVLISQLGRDPAATAQANSAAYLPILSPENIIDVQVQASRQKIAAQQLEQAKASWQLRLVNPLNPLPADFTVATTALDNGQRFDSRAYPALAQMIHAARQEGITLTVCSGYRTFAYQQGLLDRKIKQYEHQGYNRAEAEKIAQTVVALPYSSEHNLGLAADIVTPSYKTLDDGFANTAAAKWLFNNAVDYGFILRYPKDKQEITGIIYEPWHYRYVGVAAASEIKTSGVCLEEYLQAPQTPQEQVTLDALSIPNKQAKGKFIPYEMPPTQAGE